MRIGIDARFVGPQGTGLGKYTEKLIENLQKIDTKNQYKIFLRQENWEYLRFASVNFEKVLADVSWYSIGEQLKMPQIAKEQNLDLLHIPHFNVPYLYKGKFVVTIHDLIHHQFSQESATTRNFIMFKLKRLSYQKIISYAVRKSQRIITPSNFVKNQIVNTFKINSSKIVVTYEAAEEEYFTHNRHPERSEGSKQYIIYVGNAYPHKNLNRLLDAIKILNSQLIIVCPRDIFWQRLKEEIGKRRLENTVKLEGYQTAKELVKLFKKAKAYVFPSLSEGFGIPGLNAMAAGLPVVCSNIPTFKEIYADAAIYFDPTDPKDIAQKIKKVITNTKTMTDLVNKGHQQVKKYSWQKMAKETLNVYESGIKSS